MQPESESRDRPPAEVPTLRAAVESDAAELARLTAQLGYPADAAAMRARLARLRAGANDCVLVVARPDGGLAGWIHGTLVQLLESPLRVEIGGLIVDEVWRRRGLARRLVAGLEAWAVAQGAAELSVRCREERAETHAFYERMAFRFTKTQRVFRKRLGPAG